MTHSLKVLQVTAVDETVRFFLLPLVDRLSSEGYEVHIACSEGRYVSGLRERGHVVHIVTIQRKINPISNLKSLWHLYRLIKREKFDIVHVHTPVAAVLGRMAARAARVPIVIYTAHGFYFHENMSWLARRLIIGLEKCLGSITDLVLTQSEEDAITAVRESICHKDNVLWIGNGVDPARFNLEPDHNGTREIFGLNAQDKVVGFLGRLVREKGVLELIEAMRTVVAAVPEARLLLIGDTLSSDRDRTAKQEMVRLMAEYSLGSHVIGTGFIEDVPKALESVDLVVLPSHREGMPRSIIEAMASSKPVIATNIRGCREEVVPGVTGLLVPVGDSPALAEAIVYLLQNPEKAHRMGIEGRRRVLERFDERIVVDKQAKAYADIVRKKLVRGSLEETKIGVNPMRPDTLS